MRITVEDIGRACANAVATEKKLRELIERLSGKIKGLNAILAREKRVTARTIVPLDWEQPKLSAEMLEDAKRLLAYEIAEELLEEDLISFLVIDTRFTPKLTAEVRLIQSEGD